MIIKDKDLRNNKKIYLQEYIKSRVVIRTLEDVLNIEPENKNDIDKKIEKYKERCSHIKRDIENVNDTLLKSLLYRRYIIGQDFGVIAIELNYSRRHIERLHIQALDEFEITYYGFDTKDNK